MIKFSQINNINMKIKFEFEKSIINGEYSAKYFLTTRKILEDNNKKEKTLLRFKHFQNNVKVAGISECLQLLEFALPKDVYKNTKIYYVPDGTITNENDPILAIEGDYKEFGFLENIIDGILSRRSSIATNTYNIVNLIGSNKIIFMADRCDDYLLQPYDGYSAYIGGIRQFVTEKHVHLLKNYNDTKVLGTIPHALIQQYSGSLSKALIDYKKSFPDNPIVALIDFNNDCLNEIQNLYDNNIKNIDYVRIDTSKKLIDKSLQKQFEISKDNTLYGVNHNLVCNVREKLDSLGYKSTKIIVSSSINLETIKDYINKKTPIDVFGVGKNFLNIFVNFTGDLIKLNNQYLAKSGRDNNIDLQLSKMMQIN